MFQDSDELGVATCSRSVSALCGLAAWVLRLCGSWGSKVIAPHFQELAQPGWEGSPGLRAHGPWVLLHPAVRTTAVFADVLANISISLHLGHALPVSWEEAERNGARFQALLLPSKVECSQQGWPLLPGLPECHRVGTRAQPCPGLCSRPELASLRPFLVDLASQILRFNCESEALMGCGHRALAADSGGHVSSCCFQADPGIPVMWGRLLSHLNLCFCPF